MVGSGPSIPYQPPTRGFTTPEHWSFEPDLLRVKKKDDQPGSTSHGLLLQVPLYYCAPGLLATPKSYHSRSWISHQVGSLNATSAVALDSSVSSLAHTRLSKSPSGVIWKVRLGEVSLYWSSQIPTEVTNNQSWNIDSPIEQQMIISNN